MAGAEWREAPICETRPPFVGERGRILPRIGNENFELLSCASIVHTATRGDLNERRCSRIGQPAAKRSNLTMQCPLWFWRRPKFLDCHIAFVGQIHRQGLDRLTTTLLQAE